MADRYSRYNSEMSPVVVSDDGAWIKFFALVLIMGAVYGLLYLLTHSLEWSALIMLAAIGTPAGVYLWMWIRVKNHQMDLDKARLALEARIAAGGQPTQAAPFQTKRLPDGQPQKTNWAASFSGGPRIITDYDHEGKRMEVSYQALQHFIETQFPKPNRDGHWRMQYEDYTKASYFLTEIDNAPLVRTGRTFAWREGVTQEDMRGWLSDVDAPASGGVSPADEVLYS